MNGHQTIYKHVFRGFLGIICFLFATSLSAQSLNDYRTITSGDWDDPTIWEVFNGTIWVAAANYPGEVAGTNDVFIIGGNTIGIDIDITNSINSLTIGDNTGADDILDINGTSSINTQRIDMLSDGFMRWNVNVTFTLPAGAAVTIELGGGLLTGDGNCNGSKRLVIGTNQYAVCNGRAGADFSFEDLNTGGGTISVTPTSNAPICIGETLNLLAVPGGATNPDEPTTFSWTATGPGGYSFSSTNENPTITGLVVGTYIYTVTISNDGNSNTNFTVVDVLDAPNTPVSGGNQTSCIGASIPALTVTVGAGETADWYDAATGGTLLLAGNTSFTPTVGGSYFAEARNTTGGCTSVTRTEVILTISRCRIITNRRITYRVNTGPIGVPTGTLTNDLVINFFDDGPFNPYQLQIRNTTGALLNYEVFVENVPYATIPGLNLGNHTLITTNNGDGTFNYLFTSTAPIGPNATRQILGSGSPSPAGTGGACGCVTFYEL